MNNKKVVAFAMPALVLAVAAQFWLSQSGSEPSHLTVEANSRTSEAPKVDEFSNFTAQLSQAVEPKPLSSDEVWISEGIKEQMVDVAEAFKENMRYPAYSKPLHSNDWSMLNPRAFVPKLVELDLEGLSAEIVVDQYVVSRDKDLPVRVNIHGLESIEATVSEVSVFLGSGVPTIINKSSGSKGVLTYYALIANKDFGDSNDTEVPLSASITLDSGEQTRVSAVVKLAETEAVLTGLGTSFVEGSDLMIPAYFNVKEEGFYRVRANLFDQTTEAPISHINASFMLSEQENEGLLKIHASTLRSKGYEGPYVLKDFDITRGPAKPGDRTGYGASVAKEFSVQGFDLNSYSHEPYHDPKSQQRLEFLQKMAGIQ